MINKRTLFEMTLQQIGYRLTVILPLARPFPSDLLLHLHFAVDVANAGAVENLFGVPLSLRDSFILLHAYGQSVDRPPNNRIRRPAKKS